MSTTRDLPIDFNVIEEKCSFYAHPPEKKTELSIQVQDQPEIINYDIDYESESGSEFDNEYEENKPTSTSSKPSAIEIKKFKELIKLIETNMAESKGEYNFQQDEFLKKLFSYEFDSDKINHINAAIDILTSAGINKSSYFATLIISDDPAMTALGLISLEEYKSTPMASLFYDVIDPQETDVNTSDHDDYYIFLLSIGLMHSEALEILQSVILQNEASFKEYDKIGISCSQLYELTHDYSRSSYSRSSEIYLGTPVATSTETDSASSATSAENDTAPPAPTVSIATAHQEESSTQTSSAFFQSCSTPTAQPSQPAQPAPKTRFTFNGPL